MTRLNFNTLTPYAVGFDRVFDRLLEMEQPHPNNQGFPPYNIRREDEMFYIDLALAGLSEQDVDIELNMAVISNQNLRMFWGDLGRVWFFDRPSRLSPYDIISTGGQPSQ